MTTQTPTPPDPAPGPDKPWPWPLREDVNVPLLRKAVEWVEKQAVLPHDEREWDQGVYNSPRRDGCGTAYCVAGWIGATQRPDLFAHSQYGFGDIHVSDFAAAMLGIDVNAAVGEGTCSLFHASNTAADIRRIAEALAGCPL